MELNSDLDPDPQYTYNAYGPETSYYLLRCSFFRYDGSDFLGLAVPAYFCIFSSNYLFWLQG